MSATADSRNRKVTNLDMDLDDTCEQPLPCGCSTPEPRFIIAPWHVAALVCVALMLSGLSGYMLIDPDEGRYAEVPREMIQTGNFVLPQLNYVPYLEKPPLMYWVTAGSFKLFGYHEWALRLVSTVFGILGLLVAWWLGTICFGRHSGRWAPAVLASSVMYFALARMPIIDMMFSVLIAASLTAWLHGEHESGRRRYWLWVASGVLLGASLMAKGLAAPLLFGAIVFIYLLWVRKPRLLLPGIGLPVALSVLLFLPWALAAQRADPYFYQFFIVIQHIQRFLGQGQPEHVEPFYFFIVILPFGFGLWSLYWPGMLRAVKQHWGEFSPRLRADGIFLGLWFVLLMGFFSASTCKLIPYILPAWWPLAVVTAAWLQREFCREQPRRRLCVPTVISATLVALFLAAAIVVASRQHRVPALVLQRPLLILVVVGVIAFGMQLFAIWLRNRHWSLAQLAISKVLFIVAMLPAFMGIISLNDLNSVLPPQLKNLPANTPWVLAQYKTYNQSLNFYTGRRVILIDTYGELVLGKRQPDAAQWFMSGEQSIAELSKRGPLALVTRPDLMEDLARRYHLKIWNRNRDRAMLFNEAGWRLVQPAPAKAPAPVAALKPVGVTAYVSR